MGYVCTRCGVQCGEISMVNGTADSCYLCDMFTAKELKNVDVKRSIMLASALNSISQAIRDFKDD